MSKTSPPYLLTVRHSLRVLGADIKAARIRQRLTSELLARRAGISRQTLHKVEKGEPTVAMGVYANILMILGLSEGLKTLASNDKVGQEMSQEDSPKRVRPPRRGV